MSENLDQHLYRILKTFWGYDEFRDFQFEIISSIINGQDTLNIMPTGGGKSLCYQLPAIYMKGTAIVFSPLKSLMKDQVDSLIQMGVRAAYINSSLTEKEKKANLAKAWRGELDLLYIAPERFEYDHTIEMLRSIDISFFVIDEAHCISHWGHDFRTAYKSLAKLKDYFPNTKTHCFTATATMNVRADIVSLLYEKEPHERIASVDRENLTYTVRQRNRKIDQIVDVLDRHKDEAGIVYCLTRKEVEEVSAKLNAKGFDTVPYHAGFSDKARKKHQDLFVNENANIIVATVAFGMGVDRSNVRWIIHTAMPKTLEHYQQETGRAGRDGLASRCYLFYGGNDYRIHKHWIDDSANSDVMLKKLNAMYDYCQSFACRHKKLVEYFDQQYSKKSCSSCDYCMGDYQIADNSEEIAKAIIACVDEIHGYCGYGFGLKHVADILRGADTQKIRDKGHDKLLSYGVLKGESSSFISDSIAQLISHSVLERVGEYNVIALGNNYADFSNGAISIGLGRQKVLKKAKKSTFKESLSNDDIDTALFEKLRAKRTQLAKKKRVPAYHIFSDKTLMEMVVRVPCDIDSFMTVSGVGEKKAKMFGTIFTRLIYEHMESA